MMMSGYWAFRFESEQIVVGYISQIGKVVSKEKRYMNMLRKGEKDRKDERNERIHEPVKGGRTLSNSLRSSC